MIRNSKRRCRLYLHIGMHKTGSKSIQTFASTDETNYSRGAYSIRKPAHCRANSAIISFGAGRLTSRGAQPTAGEQNRMAANESPPEEPRRQAPRQGRHRRQPRRAAHQRQHDQRRLRQEHRARHPLPRRRDGPPSPTPLRRPHRERSTRTARVAPDGLAASSRATGHPRCRALLTTECPLQCSDRVHWRPTEPRSERHLTGRSSALGECTECPGRGCRDPLHSRRSERLRTRPRERRAHRATQTMRARGAPSPAIGVPSPSHGCTAPCLVLDLCTDASSTQLAVRLKEMKSS